MRAADERGSASIEIVLLTPLLVVLVGVTFFTGRLVLARQAVVDAARSALEVALTAPDGWQAERMASSTARGVLGTEQVCSSETTSTDTGHFVAGGSVTVTVTCDVRYPSLAFLRLNGAVVVSATRAGPLEPYRAIG